MNQIFKGIDRLGSRGTSRHVGVALVVAGLLGAFTGAGCRLAGPIFGREPNTPHPKATLSGTVRGPDDTSPANHRTIRAIETSTGKAYTARTNNVGDYTFFLPPGVYRLEFPLRRGETLRRQPDAIEIGPSEIKADIDLVLERSTAPTPP